MNPKIGFFSNSDTYRFRGLQIGQNLKCDPLFFATEDEALEAASHLGQAPLFFVPVLDLKKESDMSARVQGLKYAAPEAWIIVIGDKKMSPEGAAFLKKSGAQVVISEEHFLNTIEPEFIGSLRIHGQWLPIKGSELKAGAELTFDLFAFMPLNKKFVLFAGQGSVLDAAKIERAIKVGEVYFHREDFEKFQTYIKTHQDLSAKGLAARCRQQFMSVASLFKELTLNLADISESASFHAGKALLDRCYQLADDFVMTLASVGDPWAIINNTDFDDLTPLDRAPAIGALASIISLNLNLGNPTQVFLAAMVADMGLLDLPPLAINCFREQSLDCLSGESLERYQKHPLLTVNRLANRKMPVDEKLKAIILHTHECTNGRGFPNQVVGEKIPIESQLIHFAQIVDSELKVTEGKARLTLEEGMNKVLEELKLGSVISIDLINKIKKSTQV